LRIHEEFGTDINWLLTGEAKLFRHNEMDDKPSISEQADVKYEKGDDLFGSAASGLKEIFDSKDPVLVPALQANIQSFQLAVRRERQIQKQSAEIKELKKELDDLKNRFDALEKRDVGSAEAGSGRHAPGGDATENKES